MDCAPQWAETEPSPRPSSPAMIDHGCWVVLSPCGKNAVESRAADLLAALSVGYGGAGSLLGGFVFLVLRATGTAVTLVRGDRRDF